jgi:hypothetical protein
MRTITGVVCLGMALAALVMVPRSAPAAENAIPGPTYIDSQRVLDNFDKKNANP